MESKGGGREREHFLESGRRMRALGPGLGLVALMLFGRLMIGEAGGNSASATCNAVSVADSFLFRNSGCSIGDVADIFPVAIVVEGAEVSLQNALHMVYSDSNKYVAVLFYASWCPFSRAFRPTFSVLASLYPSISHLAIQESAIRPSILSKYGVRGFPALFILNSTMHAHYHGPRSLTSLAAYYSDITGIPSGPLHRVAINKVRSLLNYEEVDKEDVCPFSWARSPENLFHQETCLALATVFVLLRLAYFLFPYALESAYFSWRRDMHVRLGRLWKHPLAYVNRVTLLFISSREPRKRNSLQEGAVAVKTWASKSLASAVTIGDASANRGTSSVQSN